MEKKWLPLAVILVPLLSCALPVAAAPTKDAAAEGVPGVTEVLSGGGHSDQIEGDNVGKPAVAMHRIEGDMGGSRCPGDVSDQKDVGAPAVGNCSVIIGDSPASTRKQSSATTPTTPVFERKNFPTEKVRRSVRREPPPMPCWCEDYQCGDYELRYVNRNFTEVPRDINALSTHLCLSNNHITALLDDELASRWLPYLKDLYLDDNKISTVSQHAFRGLNNLGLLYLENNLIRHLPPNIFETNERMQVLSLAGNPLIFPGEGPILYSNSLQSITLRRCSFTSLPMEAFHGTPNLVGIGLENNEFRKLEISPFSKNYALKQVLIEHNPLQCDCDVLPILRWLKQHGIYTGGDCPGRDYSYSLYYWEFSREECNK